MSEPERADRQYTLEHYLARSDRKTLPLAHGFIQVKEGQGDAAPPLSELMRRGREAALEQYLFAHALTSGEEDGRFDARLPAFTWARALGGHDDPKTGKVESAALHQVSRNWRLLRELRLVESERAGRNIRIWLLADDGSGLPYQHVGAGKRGKRLGGAGYLQLPYSYWYERWHERLSLAAKAMLLIGLYQGDGFPLPYNKIPRWYGISAASGERGLRELREVELLHREQHRRPEPESPYGFTDVYHYELLPPFGPRGVLSKWSAPRWRGAAESTKAVEAEAGR
jgi:hypothetical protein